MNTKEIKNGLLKFFKVTKQEMKNTSIREWKELSAGWETELFSFVLEYTLNGKNKEEKLVIRMYPGETADRKLVHEDFIYSNLVKKSYPVPDIHYRSTDKGYVGKPFLIMDWINGEVLDNRMKSHSEEGLKIFCQLFVRLHKLEWKDFLRNNGSKKIDIPTINSHLEAQERRIAEDSVPELLPIIHWLKEKRKEIKNEQLAIGHFDFHPFNILINEQEEPFVIDWPAARVNDFRFDLGWTLVLFCVYSDRNNRDALFSTYQTVSGEQIDHIDFFEVSAILRRLNDILAIFKSNNNSISLRDDVAEQIKDTIFHVENLNNYLEALTNIRIQEIDELIYNIKNSD